MYLDFTVVLTAVFLTGVVLMLVVFVTFHSYFFCGRILSTLRFTIITIVISVHCRIVPCFVTRYLCTRDRKCWSCNEENREKEEHSIYTLRWINLCIIHPRHFLFQDCTYRIMFEDSQSHYYHLLKKGLYGQCAIYIISVWQDSFSI